MSLNNSGRLGVFLAMPGSGGVYLLNGLYEAKMDDQPVLAITIHHFDLADKRREMTERPQAQ